MVFSGSNIYTTKSNSFKTPTWDDKRLQSMCSPFPVLYLWSKPAIIAPYVYNPVARSVMATPALTGSPSWRKQPKTRQNKTQNHKNKDKKRGKTLPFVTFCYGIIYTRLIRISFYMLLHCKLQEMSISEWAEVWKLPLKTRYFYSIYTILYFTMLQTASCEWFIMLPFPPIT